MNWFTRFWKALNQPGPAFRAPAQHAAPIPNDEALNNFSPRAQQVLALSRREADRFHHNFVGTEHLLLGLIALGQGTAVTVLRKLGLDLETVRIEVENQVGTGPDQKMMGNIPYTPRVKKVLAFASKEARSLNHTYVGTEHILLGILREGDGVAGRVLKNLQVDIEQTRLVILKELDPNFATDYSQIRSTSPKDAAPISSGSGSPPTHAPAKTTLDLIDVEKRYDVYCSELTADVVVYRNVTFKGLRRLFRQNHDSETDFIELELPDGQTLFVVKYSIIKFCAPGATPGAEKVPRQNS